jgi:hypothetical protein
MHIYACSCTIAQIHRDEVHDLLRPRTAPSASPAASPASSSHASPAAAPPGASMTTAAIHRTKPSACSRVSAAPPIELRIESVAAFAAAYDVGISNRTMMQKSDRVTSSRAHTVILIKHEFNSKVAPYETVVGHIRLIDVASGEESAWNASTNPNTNGSALIRPSLSLLRGAINTLVGEARILNK